MPTLNLSDNKTISGYVSAMNAELNILSVPTKQLLKFPAFLTDFSQTFDATWNTEEVFGRMDPIATYQGTKRTVSLAFDLPAGSADEAKKNLDGCAELVKMVYPVYNRQDILSKPPLVRIQFANLIKGDTTVGLGSDTSIVGLLGWISGLSWTPNLDMGMYTTDGELYPKVVSLSFSFNVLHEKTPSQNAANFPFGG